MAQPSRAVRPIRVAIIGGGIGGVLTFIGLSKNPHLQVTIYEASHQVSEYGAGVSFDMNGLGALKALDPRCIEAYKQHETKNTLPGHETIYIRLAEATGPNAGRFFLDIHNKIGASTTHRARFLEALVVLLSPNAVEFNKKMTSIDDRGSDGLTVFFEDGTNTECDVLLGADGANSLTRIHLLGKDHPAAYPVYAGTAGFRALIPMNRALAAMGEEHAKSKTIEVGPGGFHMHYPISHGEQVNIVLVTCRWKDWTGPLRRAATKQELADLLY